MSLALVLCKTGKESSPFSGWIYFSNAFLNSTPKNPRTLLVRVQSDIVLIDILIRIFLDNESWMNKENEIFFDETEIKCLTWGKMF